MPDVPSGVPAAPWLESLRERMERLPFEPSQVVAGVLVVAVLAVAGVARLVSAARGPTSAQVEAGLPRAEDGTTTTTTVTAGAVGDAAGEVVVHVAGAVAQPGLYRLPAGARVADALAAAGGAAAEADVDRVNLA
ncbi:MAG TPA: SLBB domain-containing protein, partial [Acidimicrobiales bacterium]